MLAIVARASYVAFFCVLLTWFSHLHWFKSETGIKGGDVVSFNYHPLFMARNTEQKINLNSVSSCARLSPDGSLSEGFMHTHNNLFVRSVV